MGIIYKVTNTSNAKLYIGKSVKTLAQRRADHYYDAKRENNKSYFHKALLSNDRAIFTWEVIDTVNNDDLNQAEINYIAQYRDNNYQLYNLTAGGDGLPKGYKHSEETKAKIRESNIRSRSKIGMDYYLKPD